MADNRIYQVVLAVKAALTGLASTSSNPGIHRATEYELTDLPAVDIKLAESEVVASDIATQDIEQTVIVTATVADNGDYIEKMLQLQKEVHLALREDYTLGLPSMVHDIKYEGAGEVKVSGEGDTVVAEIDSVWTVQLRTSLSDISS